MKDRHAERAFAESLNAAHAGIRAAQALLPQYLPLTSEPATVAERAAFDKLDDIYALISQVAFGR